MWVAAPSDAIAQSRLPALIIDRPPMSVKPPDVRNSGRFRRYICSPGLTAFMLYDNVLIGEMLSSRGLTT